MPNKKLTVLLVFVLTFFFYLYTLSPSLAWGDGVRLQSEAISGESFILSEMTGSEFSPDPYPFSKVGITAWDHPLYIVIGHSLVSALPSVDSIWLVNLISALFGAATVALIFLLSYRFTSSFMASMYAALSLAVSHTFWWHSSTPEVYTLFAFLLVASLYFFDQFERTNKVSALTASTFFLGLAGTNHILAFVALPALAIYLLPLKRFWHILPRKPREYIPPLLGFMLGFLLFLIQLFRMTHSFSIAEIMGPIVGSTFLGGLGTFSLIPLAESLITYLLFLSFQFSPLGIILGVFGIRKVFDNPDPSLRKIVWLYIAYTVFGIFYQVTDQFAFFLTSHVFFALLMGIGAAYLFTILWTKARIVLTSILLLSIVAVPFVYRAIPRLAQINGIGDSALKIPQIGTGLRNGLAYYIDPNKRGDFAAYDFGYETITNLAPDAVVIAEWYTDTDEYFILRYFHKVVGERPDVTVIGFPTDDPFSFDPQLVLDVIADAFPRHPVYLASLSYRFYATSTLIEKYCILPEDNIYRLYPKGNDALQCLGSDAVTE